LFYFFRATPPPRSTLFPYTTLFRSRRQRRFRQAGGTSSQQANLLHQFRRTAMKTNWRALKYGCLVLAGLTLATKPAPAQTVESRSEEHTSELQSRGHLVCRPLLEKK